MPIIATAGDGKNYTPAPTGTHQAGSVAKRCERCDWIFRVHPYRAESAKYCSRACARRDQTGARAGGWRGGKMAHSAGYVAAYDPEHPNVMPGHGCYVYEHRRVAAEMLGRPLLRSEVVHHKNGDKADNRPENLAVMSQSQHARLHAAQRAVSL